MSTRTLTRLLATAGVLVALWLLITLISRAGGSGQPPASDDWSAFLASLTPDSVTSVTIDDDGEVRVLAKQGDTWTIDGFPSDSATVARFWTNLADASAGEIVARNPDNHARMGVAEDSTLAVTFAVGGEDRTLLVGNEGTGYGTAFSRRPGEDEVRLLTGGLRTHFIRSVSDWRDKRIVVVDTARVDRIDIARGGESYSVVRADSAWMIDGDTAQASPVRGALEELSTMRATGFFEEGDSLYALPEEITVTALSGADTLGTVTLSEGSGDRAARARGNPTVYRLPSFRVDRIAPTREQLEPPG